MFRAIVILFLVLGGVGNTLALGPATVTLPLITLVQGQNSEIEAQIDCAPSVCDAFDITIQFDPHVMQVDAMRLGPFLGDQVFLAKNMIDNQAGLLRLAATALGDTAQTDETVLLILDVTAMKPGVSQLQVVSLNIGDRVGDPLETDATDGGVMVSGNEVTPTAVPETCEYQVRTGDTLFGIALANHVTVDDILALNDIPDSRTIRVGDVLTIPATECAASAPVSTGAGGSSDIIEVYDCRYIGNNLFEWYSAQRNYDSAGNPVSETRTGGPYTGEWRPGCPAGEQPSSGSSGGSGSSSGGGNSSDGGSKNSGGGLGVCVGSLCL